MEKVPVTDYTNTKYIGPLGRMTNCDIMKFLSVMLASGDSARNRESRLDWI